MLIKLFQKAGATGRVYALRGGKVRDLGLAYSGLVSPWTTIAVVPETPQVIDFSIDAITEDLQDVVVPGSITITLDPATVVSKLDFTVDQRSGGYVGDWQKVLRAQVIAHVLRAVVDTVGELDIEAAIRSQKQIEDAVLEALGKTGLTQDGIILQSCSIPSIEPGDDDVGEALGAEQREALLTGADAARQARRLKSLEGDRALKAYEAATVLTLEEARAALIAQQSANKLAEAEADAVATKTRLAPLQDAAPGTLLGAAIMDAAKTGRLGNLSITSEFLAAIGQK